MTGAQRFAVRFVVLGLYVGLIGALLQHYHASSLWFIPAVIIGAAVFTAAKL